MINYIKGDVREPIVIGKKIITHICNDIGLWNSGVAKSISDKWYITRQSYISWDSLYGRKRELGCVQFVPVETNIIVANMIAQHETIRTILIPIRYSAVETCLTTVCIKAIELNASIHMPRIGCGLARGKWERIEPIITNTLINKGIKVFVYDRE